MSRGYGSTKRRIESAKRQKREAKRLKRLNKGHAPEQALYAEPSVLTELAAEPPAEQAAPEAGREI